MPYKPDANNRVLFDPTGRFSKILAAIDGSESSIDASQYAISIAKQYNSKLTAISVVYVHGIKAISSSFITAPTFALDAFEKAKKDAQQSLNDIKLKAEGEGVELTTEIIEPAGSVEGSIVNYAENNGIDLIVLGTRGRSGFTKLLLGSVALGVVKYAHCPVLVVK